MRISSADGAWTIRGQPKRGYDDNERAAFNERVFKIVDQADETLDLSGVVFPGPVSFREAIFSGAADFLTVRQSAVAGDSVVKFNLSDFRKSRFVGPVQFTNRRFLAPARFEDCVFETAPAFHGCEIHQGSTFPGKEGSDTKTEAAAQAYRTLKLAMETNRSRHEEAMFYALEQRALDALAR